MVKADEAIDFAIRKSSVGAVSVKGEGRSQSLSSFRISTNQKEVRKLGELVGTLGIVAQNHRSGNRSHEKYQKEELALKWKEGIILLTQEERKEQTDDTERSR